MSDCVVERTGSQKYTDAVPKSGQYVMGHYTAKTGNATKGTCTVPSTAELLPLTSTKQTLLDKISGLTATWHRWSSRHRMGLVHAVAQLGVALALEHARGLRHR